MAEGRCVGHYFKDSDSIVVSQLYHFPLMRDLENDSMFGRIYDIFAHQLERLQNLHVNFFLTLIRDSLTKDDEGVGYTFYHSDDRKDGWNDYYIQNIPKDLYAADLMYDMNEDKFDARNMKNEEVEINLSIPDYKGAKLIKSLW
jgi:hypothetical protein